MDARGRGGRRQGRGAAGGRGRGAAIGAVGVWHASRHRPRANVADLLEVKV